MDCGEIRKKLAMLETELSGSDRKALEEHLCQCENCREEKTLLESAWAVLDGFRAPVVSPDFTPRLMARIHELEAKKPRLGFPEFQFDFRLASAVLLCAVLAAAIYLRIQTGRVPQPEAVRNPPVAREIAVPVKGPAAAEIKTLPPGHEQAASVTVPPVVSKPFPASMPDAEIIRNLNVYENAEFFQNYEIASDLDVVQNPGAVSV